MQNPIGAIQRFSARPTHCCNHPVWNQWIRLFVQCESNSLYAQNHFTAQMHKIKKLQCTSTNIALLISKLFEFLDFKVLPSGFYSISGQDIVRILVIYRYTNTNVVVGSLQTLICF